MTTDLGTLNQKVLERFAEELHEADTLQLVHLAQRAEGRFRSDLGVRMRQLVADERDLRTIGNLLTALGATTADVAATLHRAGYTGEPCVSNICPVAKYVQHYGFRDVLVGTCDVDVLVGTDEATYHHLIVALPEPVQQFVRDFDRGRHPQLMGEPIDDEREFRMGGAE
jgi:hypothetical protein